MELPTHPLLSLVEDNANGLKSMLTSYIDDTVDYQFAILKNRILKMIENGLIRNGFIDPLYSENALDFVQTTFTTGQSNIDLENALILRHSNDQLATAYEQNTTQMNSNNSTDQIAPEQIKFQPTSNKLRTSNNNLTYNEDDNSEEGYSELDYLNGIKDEEEYGDDETGEQIEINQGDEESSRLDVMQIVDTIQQLNQQSIPSTSGLRSSDRKRTPRKVFGDHQSNDKVKSDKRKSKNNSGKAVKKVKHQDIDEIHLEGDKDVKPKIVTLELNCTEPGCEKTLKSREIWKEHLSKCHGQVPYKHLDGNVRHNQHGQIEFACTECELVCISQDSLYRHWRHFHQPGKFQCSLCAFVANFRSEFRNHKRNSHRSSKYQCTHQECNKVFSCNRNLEKHLRIHTGERPFVCVWKKCKLTFNQHQAAIRHVRAQHFHLPRTVKEQQELNIIDTRDPKVFVKVCQG